MFKPFYVNVAARVKKLRLHCRSALPEANTQDGGIAKRLPSKRLAFQRFSLKMRPLLDGIKHRYPVATNVFVAAIRRPRMHQSHSSPYPIPNSASSKPPVAWRAARVVSMQKPTVTGTSTRL